MKPFFLQIILSLFVLTAIAQNQTTSLYQQLRARDMDDHTRFVEMKLLQQQEDMRARQFDISTLDSTKSFSWNPDLQSWFQRNTGYYYYGFNRDTFLQVDGAQENSSRVITLYNDSGLEIEWSSDYWDGVEWVPGALVTNNYNANNQLLGYVFMLGSGGVLENYVKLEYTYDGNGALIEQLQQRWVGDAWEDDRRHTFTNNAQHQPVMEIVDYWVGFWQPTSRYTTTYGSNHERLEFTAEGFDTEWEPSYRIVYTYADGQTQLINERLDDFEFGTWFPQSQTDYSYDQHGNVVLEVYQDHDGADWYNVERYRSAYDQEQNQVTWINEGWDGEWVNYDSAHYYYTIVSSVAEYQVINSVTVSPNPVSGTLKWNLENEPAFTLVNVYNTHGQLFQLPLEGQAGQLNVSSLTPGMYILQLPTDKGLSIARFIVQ